MGHGGAVVDFGLYLNIGFARIECKTGHAFGSVHTLHFAAPYGFTAVGKFLDVTVGWQEGAWAVMLRPVEFNAAGYPRAGQSHQGGLDHLVVIYKVALLHFIVCHVDASAQFGENHYLDIFVFDEESPVSLVFFLIGDFLDHRIRIYGT